MTSAPLTLTHTCDDVTVTMELNTMGESWPEMFQHFRRFLGAIGYEVPIGEWVEHEETTFDGVSERLLTFDAVSERLLSDL